MKKTGEKMFHGWQSENPSDWVIVEEDMRNIQDKFILYNPTQNAMWIS